MYYLVNVELIRPNWANDTFLRLVKAKDKNDAWDKTKNYLLTSYISVNHPWNKDFYFKIEVQDTIT
jgi:hypothetical protein